MVYIFSGMQFIKLSYRDLNSEANVVCKNEFNGIEYSVSFRVDTYITHNHPKYLAKWSQSFSRSTH